jgi:hypothetical protein
MLVATVTGTLLLAILVRVDIPTIVVTPHDVL